MGDDRIRRLVRQSAEFHSLKESKDKRDKKKLADMVEQMAATYEDSAALGQLALETIVRQNHLAMQVEVDRIVKITDPAERGKALQALIDDFAIAAEDKTLGEFARAQIETLGEFKRVSDDPAAFETMRKARRSAAGLSEDAKRTDKERFREFMRETEFGRKVLDAHEDALALAERLQRPAKKLAYQAGDLKLEVSGAYEQLREGSELLRFGETARATWAEFGTNPIRGGATVADAAMKLTMLVDAMDAVGNSRTNADLAYNLGKVMWSNSHVGMIANSAYAFVVGGDNDAFFKFVAIALCPEAAIPDLVGKLGSFSMRSGAQRLFDAQLEALYQASRFAGDLADDPKWKDKDPWLLADFVGYGAGAAGVTAFLDVVLQPGGHVEAENMIVKNGQQGSEIERGNEAIAKAAVVKAIWMTLQTGDAIVLRDDGALLEATQRIKFLTDQIVDIGRNMGKDFPRTPDNFSMPEGASPGEQAALNKLIKQRDMWLDKAKAAMADAIVRTFEERRRADSDLSDKAMKDRLNELKALLTKLDILTPGLEHLGQEGGSNAVQQLGGYVSSGAAKDQLRRMVQAINRYHDAYSHVLGLRDALTPIIQLQTGAPPAKRPLTGAPPLCGERAIDLQFAQTYFEKARAANGETTESLANVKGAPLAGAFDERIRHGVNAAVLAMAEEDMTSQIAQACRASASARTHGSYTETSSQAMQRYEQARLKRDALKEEFRAYYAAIKALQAQIDVSPPAPIQGETVQAGLRVNAALPEGASWKWTLDDEGRAVASAEGATFRFQAPFRGAYTLVAELKIADVTVKRFSANLNIGARAGLSVSLAPSTPEPGGLISAQAQLNPARENIEYVWTCANCAIESAQAASASLRAPNDGAGSVRVSARTGGATIVEASAPFQVTPARKPPPQTSDDRSTPRSDPQIKQSLLPQSPGQTPDRTSQKTAGQSPTATQPKQDDGRQSAHAAAKGDANKDGANKDGVVADYPLGTWEEALRARNEYRALSQRADYSEKARSSAREKLAAAEKRMQEIWARDRDVATGLPSFVQKYIDELKRIYAEFARTAPAKPTGSRPSGNVVTDLEGDDAWSRYECANRMEREETGRLATLDAFLVKAKAAENAFAAPYDGADRAAAAVRAYDALWPARDISADWRTKGAETSIRNPCQDNAKPATLKLPPGGPAPAAPAMPPIGDKAGPLPTVALSVDASGTARTGEIAVIARISGGKTPYKFAWIGALRAAGERAVYAAPVGVGAKGRAAVKATDAAGAEASAELALEAPKVVVELARTDPSVADIRIGQKVSFAARVTVDAKPADAAAFVLRWEPSTEARFERAEGPGVATNSATFSRIGKTKVWVVALQRVGATLATVGESAQIELNVVGAEISLQANPATPRIGQEVKITAREQPAVSDRDASYWWEYKGQALNAGATANPRVFSYVPKDASPVVVTAHLKEKTRGEELAVKSLTVEAQPYSVSIAMLGPAWENSTTRPIVWRPGVGLVTLDKEIAAHQDVALRADVTPQPATPQLRYRWTVGQGGLVAGNPGARETRVQGASVGSLEAKVEVRDANDIVLGSASTSVNVTVSDAEIATGKAKATELAKLKEESAKAWADGDIDAACDKGKAAREIDPAFAQVQTYCTGRDRIAAFAKEGAAALAGGATKDNVDRAQTALDQGRAVNTKARLLDDLAKKIAEMKTTIEAARQAADQAKSAAKDKPTTGAPAKGTTQLATDIADDEKKCREIAQAGISKQAAGDFRGAIPLYQQALDMCPALCPVMSNLGVALSNIGNQVAGRRWAEEATRCDPANDNYKKNLTALGGPPSPSAPPPSPPADKDKQCRDIATVGIGKQTAGDHRGAIPLYQQALDLCPRLCPVMANLGLAYNATGNPAAGRQWAEAATRCDPANENYKKNLAAIAGAQQPKAPPPPPPAANYDGVYRYTSTNATITYEVRGSRIYYSWSTDPQHRKFEAPVNANGEFHLSHTLTGTLIALTETTIDGRVSNGQITGRTRFRYKTDASSQNWSGDNTKDFVAKRIN